MADIIAAYSAISASSARTELADVLNRIINAPPFTFTQTSRVQLMQAIMHDLKNAGSKGKLTSKDAAQALLSLKTLGKDPAGSRYLASSTNLSNLLGFATTFKDKDEPEATSEALRSIANALLLVEEARSTLISKEVNGGECCILMLEKTTSPDLIFIIARILFLATASGPTYLETMVDSKFHGKSFVDIITSKMDLALASIHSGSPMAKEALTDLLKLLFNVLLHYPKMTESEPQNSESTDDDKVLGDFWDAKLDPVLPPLLRAFRDLPPTSPCPITAPMTHVIHTLISIPFTPALRPIWFGQHASTLSRSSTSNSPKGKAPQLLESKPGSRSDSPTRSEKSPTTSKGSTIDRALSAIGRTLSRTSSPSTAVDIDVAQRAFALLDQGLAFFFPGNGDPDAPETRPNTSDPTVATADEVLSPVTILLSRICIADETSRLRIRQWIVPSNLDRSSPLDERADVIGRCLRLLASVYHSRLKDAVGQMLYAACDQDAGVMSAYFGYGHIAGFLYNKGIMSAPPAPSNGPVDVPTDIDPITGLKKAPKAPEPEMTEEERAQEMEKLFVLFDRLERSGAVPPERNPVREAIRRQQMDS